MSFVTRDTSPYLSTDNDISLYSLPLQPDWTNGTPLYSEASYWWEWAQKTASTYLLLLLLLIFVIPTHSASISSAEEWASTTTTSTFSSVLSLSDNLVIILSGSKNTYESTNPEVIEVIWFVPIIPIIPTFNPFSRFLTTYSCPNSSAWSLTIRFSLSKW